MFKDKTVLVTGGTGTFGHAFVKRMLAEPVKKVIIFSRDELKQYEMQRHPEYADERLRFFIGDIRDLERLRRAFAGVDVVVHAAALKQVPATEYNPMEAVRTNVLGSQNIVDAALDVGVQKVLLISSDKAVSPVNLYGATKLCAERLFIAANAYRQDGGSAFSVMRYGNVIGSRGSLVELIRKKRETGTITLTDERMTRFWIPIEQVIEVIVEQLSRMQGGEIFVPKMKNLPVADVIKMIAPECSIELIGVRPGEKMHETLVTEHEAQRTRDAGSVYAIEPEFSSVDLSWLADLPKTSEDFSLVSNNKEFLLSREEAAQLFECLEAHGIKKRIKQQPTRARYVKRRKTTKR